MSEGVIYILTNRAMPGYIKIGMTQREDIKSCLKELYSTGVPFPFELHYAVKMNDVKSTESIMHQIFSIHRENMDREFFKMDPERAVLALKLTNGQEISLSDTEVYQKEDQELIESTRKLLAPALKFSMIGLKEGYELTFSRNENIKCVIASDSTVEYQEQIYSLSGLAKELLGKPYGVQGPAFWMYQGKLLTEMRRELEESE
ncbi:MAG: GIY-YIG nuclease family protein [Brevinema sp.]